jgi:hypothetical protein
MVGLPHFHQKIIEGHIGSSNRTFHPLEVA